MQIIIYLSAFVAIASFGFVGFMLCERIDSNRAVLENATIGGFLGGVLVLAVLAVAL